MERDPVQFLASDLERELDAVRAILAAFVGADADDLVFMSNATAGISTVLRSLAGHLGPTDEVLTTDHEYNATFNALRWLARVSGAKVVVARIAFPQADADEAREAILAAATPRTRLAVISQVTSASAIVLPIEQLVGELRDRGIETLVDAAHAAGMVPLGLASTGAAYTVANGHKWLCAPKGSGFLHVRRDRQAELVPLAISHGPNMSPIIRSRFRLEFDWTGTVDPSALLALPEALRFMGSLHSDGWPGVMAANHLLVLTGRDLLCRALNVVPLAPDSMLGSMAAIPLPDGLVPPPSEAPVGGWPEAQMLPPDPLHDWLLARHAIQVPVYAFPVAREVGRPSLRLLRISAQRYNTRAEYERLASVLSGARSA